jgi:hypothetical protein
MDIQARVGHQRRDLGDAAEVFDAVGFGKAQILVEPMPHVVAIEQIRVPPREHLVVAHAPTRSLSSADSGVTLCVILYNIGVQRRPHLEQLLGPLVL